jgi:hypothetical protein
LTWFPQHFLNFAPEAQGRGALRGFFEPRLLFSQALSERSEEFQS